MAERIIDSNGIRLWTEDFGDRRHPTLLLVMDASAQGIEGIRHDLPAQVWTQIIGEMIAVTQRA
jgi:hypothetical protein